jgi:hypothetical protein
LREFALFPRAILRCRTLPCAFNNKPFTGTFAAAMSAVTSVPEPGTLVILSSVLLIFGLARRRMAPLRITRRAPRSRS